MQQQVGRLVFSPSDLNAFLACPHLTTLQLAVARGEIGTPYRVNRHADLIRRKGDEHEAAYLASLGDGVVAIGKPWEIGWEVAADLTAEAMRGGAPVVYQAAFVDGPWRGLADFVERRPDGTYEALDTKLARHAKPEHVLQLCFYTEGIARIQGRVPAAMHVVNGLGERETFRPDDYLAYARRLRRRFLAVVGDGPAATYPYPVAHCGLCEFLARCQAQWEHDDHLTLVAGVSRLQHDRLVAAGIRTVEGLGAAPPGTRVSKIRPETFAKLRHQAELQLHRRHTGEHRVDLLPLEPDRGFALLPEPSAGDVWLDLEGHPWFEPARGLEFLLGWIERDEAGEPRYRCLWARDRAGEREALERLVDHLTERRRRYPGMHVYHYAAYERSALTRLAGEHGTREGEVDDLLRGEVLVDLYRVTRQALRASVPSYSIKEIEALYGFERRADVSGGTEAVDLFERWLAVGDDALLEAIRRYNEEDCVSTLELHRWLLAQRPADLPWRPPPPPREEPSAEAQEWMAERERVRAALLAGAVEGEPDWLLAHLLEYHRREARPQWWAYFHNKGLDDEELIESGETIGGLELAGEPAREKQSLVYTFTFPAQEHKIGSVGVDPENEREYDNLLVSDEQGTVTLRRGLVLEDVPLPRALIPPEPLPTGVQRGALLRFAKNRERYPAIVDILERRPPRARLGGTLEEAVLSLDRSYLFVQGPPGSGKTWRGARLAIALMQAGRRVGVTALSHKAIHKFLEDVEEAADEQGYRFRGLKKSGGSDGSRYEGRGLVESTDSRETMLEDDVQLLAGTSFLFAREELDGHVDVLFVDEGGQYALADTLAVGTAAKSLVLLGDPNQLPQVSQAAHPPGANASVLQHLLGDDETVREGMGVFLGETWRLRPEVCDFVSEAFYEGRLSPAEPARRRSLALGNGLRFVPVEHSGHRSAAPEEAEAVAAEIERLVGSPFVDADGVERPLRNEDVKVVAPFNAHVRCLREKLPAAVQVGTVDKFQGQQCVVAFFSMASSSGEDVPRGLEFLFSRNRLNVAVSRAQCLAYVVASPRLLDVRGRTVEQMRLANARCRRVGTAAGSG
ncbi:MAG: TM0106 family RecB-like putative nuclease [Thermoleophilia bacterium]|nr:TM0106 family RecB-like putative nuclease [Thermoleophilia bacterium]